MKKYIYNKLSEKKVTKLCQRPKMNFQSVFGEVEPIIRRVQQEGDAGINYFNQKFDGVKADPLVIDPAETEVSLDKEIQLAIDTAFDNIYRFHKAQLPIPLEVETMPGVRCKRIARPIERVGLYVPGGTAVLLSTLLMLGIPAALAGCKRIVLATPPKKDGSIADEIIYISQKIGAACLLKAGGAQAVAGMAFGSESVPKVDKIFGPGNQYVTAAKMLLQNSDAQIAIDMPAGPSEVLVIADQTARPDFVAADLLSQAEHGADSQVVLVATEDFEWDLCFQSLDKQTDQLPRKEVAKKALRKSFSIKIDTLKEAFEFSNQYAPEHLIVQCEKPDQWEEKITNAGSVFLGKWTPESAGDYASGTNHTLPTYGYAKMYSGVSIDSFIKQITLQQISEAGLKNLGSTVKKLADLEELEGHKNAVSIRLQALNHNS